jgi:glycosyltransferase involved in cell wall biosynthesis
LTERICFIGPLNEGNYPVGGDQYKNQLLLSEMKAHGFLVTVVDTVRWKHNISVWLKILVCFMTHFKFKGIIISASTNSALRFIGMAQLFPFIKGKINYWVIGGILHKKVKKNPNLVELLKNTRKIAVETRFMYEQLLEMGLNNIVQIPNFKNFDIEKLPYRLKKQKDDKKRLVYVSRICEEKGVEVIFKAFPNRDNLEIHFFGPVKSDFQERFNNLLNENSNFKYLGMLNLQEDIETSLNILGSYDIFLFPSFWESEGHPGALIDAMTSGLAIVATDWNSNAEFTNGNGLFIPTNDAEALKKAVDFYIENPTELEKHQIKSSERAKEYHSSNICPKYLNSLS